MYRDDIPIDRSIIIGQLRIVQVLDQMPLTRVSVNAFILDCARSLRCMPPSVIAISEIAVSDNCRISSSVTLRICDDICSRNARMTLPTPSPVCVGPCGAPSR